MDGVGVMLNGELLGEEKELLGDNLAGLLSFGIEREAGAGRGGGSLV